MNGRVALRPFLPADAPRLIEIFRASVEESTAEDYSESQRAAWSSAADDSDAFIARVTLYLAVVATIDGEPCAYASLRDNGHLDHLFVHPAFIGRGLASLLCGALEKLAAARGARTLAVDSSDAAMEFFAKRAFEMKQRNSVLVGGEWLANTTMEKQLPSAQPRPHKP